MSDYVLEVKNIEKSYGNVRAVQGISLNVKPGEILGVIGPNGCGKSTLFNCILGGVKADSGKVYLWGKDVTGWSPVKLSRAGMGRTFQSLQVFSTMTVQENLLSAMQEHVGTVLSRLLMPPTMGLIPEVNKTIEDFRLGHLATEKAGNLSYGQQKLLDIAMAFAGKPKIVLLDEPAGGVNLSMLTEVKDRLVETNRTQNTTLVIIEHNMEFIFEVAHRILVLAEGQVLMLGTSDEIRSDPRVIQAYLGSDT